MNNEPTQIKKRAIDVIPYYHAIWCQIGEGEPFANPVCSRRYAEDGLGGIWFMLDSHNTLFAKSADELVDVVEITPPYPDSDWFLASIERDKKKMGIPPPPIHWWAP